MQIRRNKVAHVCGIPYGSCSFRILGAGLLLCLLSLQGVSWRLAWRLQKSHAERLARLGDMRGLTPLRIHRDDLERVLAEKNEITLTGVWFDIMRHETCGPDTLILWLWRDEIETAILSVWLKKAPISPYATPAALALSLWLHTTYLAEEAPLCLVRSMWIQARVALPVPPDAHAQCAPTPLSPPPESRRGVRYRRDLRNFGGWA